MTRFAIDAAVAVQLARDEVRTGSEHQLVAPSLLRSEVLSMLYRAVRDGTLEDKHARLLLDRVTTMKIRLLGDRVSRAVAWQIAAELGWNDTPRAEYLAVAKLQADRLVTFDPVLERAAPSYVATAPVDELYV
ncbi:MAG TPA: hypothetical protein VFJ19_19620 [Nocardioidaceae bacterium]|nr:hypothetical protein [Nocardioidaceae bacterium]